MIRDSKARHAAASTDELNIAVPTIPTWARQSRDPRRRPGSVPALTAELAASKAETEKLRSELAAATAYRYDPPPF